MLNSNPTAKAPVDFVCCKCAYGFQKTLGWLQDHKEVLCPACDFPVNTDNFNLREIEHTTRGVDEIRASLDDPLDLTVQRQGKHDEIPMDKEITSPDCRFGHPAVDRY